MNFSKSMKQSLSPASKEVWKHNYIKGLSLPQNWFQQDRLTGDDLKSSLSSRNLDKLEK